MGGGDGSTVGNGEGALVGARVMCLVGRPEGCAEGLAVVDANVGRGLGIAEVGVAVARTVGNADGASVGTELGFTVGRVVGNADGAGVCNAVGATDGIVVGRAEGRGVGIMVGAVVGLNVTTFTPSPATSARPSHFELPVQPSRTIYVCGGVPAGTVYCTCAHTSPPVIH